MDWTENGVMTKGSTETTNRGIDIAVQSAKTIVSLLSKGGAFGATGFQSDDEMLRSFAINCLGTTIPALLEDLKTLTRAEMERLAKQQKLARAEVERLSKALIAAERLTKENPADLEGRLQTLMADAVAKVSAREQNLYAYRKQLTDFYDAFQIYEKILSLQNQRESLFTPVAAPPADTLQVMLKELDALIKHFKEMFLGTTSKETWNARFAVTPLKHDWSGTGKYFGLFEFSADDGVCQILSNTEVMFMDSKIKKGFSNCGGATANRETVQLNLMVNPGQIATTISASFNDKSEDGERGFYYRIPVMTSAVIIRSSKETSPKESLRTQLAVAQLGTTVSLPASTGGRKTKYEVELYETGALKNFKLGSEALIQDTTVKGFGEAAETALDKRAEAKKAAAAANDPLAQVKSVSDLLAECKKIKDAQEALGQPVSLPKQCTP
jgi:hypothetical protein